MWRWRRGRRGRRKRLHSRGIDGLALQRVDTKFIYRDWRARYEDSLFCTIPL